MKNVIILTGFLGAGKTTFLNAYLQKFNTQQFAIIENEIGDIGIDGQLILQNQEAIFELSDGCICCSINHNFIDTLKSLMESAIEWDELIIEGTGIANPAGIIAPFKQYPVLKKYFHITKTICLVDAIYWEKQSELSDVFAQQIAYSDIILLTKSDLCSDSELEEIKTKLYPMNPLATILIGNKNEYPMESILNIEKRKNFFQLTPPSTVDTTHEITIHSISFSYDFFIDKNLIHQRMNTFLMFQSENIYRFKGIFYTKNNEKYSIQSVMKSLFIEKITIDKEEEKISRFVFIGKNLEAKGYDRMLRQCFVS